MQQNDMIFVTFSLIFKSFACIPRFFKDLRLGEVDYKFILKCLFKTLQWSRQRIEQHSAEASMTIFCSVSLFWALVFWYLLIFSNKCNKISHLSNAMKYWLSTLEVLSVFSRSLVLRLRFKLGLSELFYYRSHFTSI